MTEFILFLRNLFNLYKYIIFLYEVKENYITGMVEYINLNEITKSRWYVIKTNILGIYDETIEVINEILCFNIRNIIIELLDLYHSVLILFVFILLPKCYWTNEYVWNIMFYISFIITPVKHGKRYIYNHCIRSSQHCIKRTHICRSLKKIVSKKTQQEYNKYV